MRPAYRWLSALLILILIFLLIALAAIYFRSLLSEYGEAEETPALSLPLPILIPLIAFPILSVLLAAWLTVRAVFRIRKKEREEQGKEEENY